MSKCYGPPGRNVAHAAHSGLVLRDAGILLAIATACKEGADRCGQKKSADRGKEDRNPVGRRDPLRGEALSLALLYNTAKWPVWFHVFPVFLMFLVLGLGHYKAKICCTK